MKTRIVSTVALLVFCCVPAFAAEQGQIGRTSSATVSMTITIEPQLKVKHDAAEFVTSGNSQNLPVSSNFDGGYSIKKFEVPVIEKLRSKNSKQGKKRYALVVIPSVE